MRRLPLIFLAFVSCGQPSYVDLSDKVDPEIVIINIEEGDRAFIGNILLTIDSCRPKLIAIDAWFVSEKDTFQDSVLATALSLVDNDVLAYTLDAEGRPLKSHDKFTKHASSEGLAILNNIDGLSSHITPIQTIDNKVHELFALRIVRTWKPDFINRFDNNETIPIHFTRTIDQFLHLNGSNLTSKDNANQLMDKIVLLGYLGPSNEDKHFTPIRNAIKHEQEEPDTYGVVVVANQIRTILNYKD